MNSLTSPVVRLYLGDCSDVLASLPENSIDSVVCDPPYGLTQNKRGGSGVASLNLASPAGRSRVTTGGGFMGKEWDAGVPDMEYWAAILRAAKPGAHLLAFGGTRTFHRLAVAIEDAGWEIRDTLMWVYGSGFPKSMDVSKQLDKMTGAEREVVHYDRYRDGIDRTPQNNGKSMFDGRNGNFTTAPATPEAAQWAGWGTALKPAWEPIIMARKPFAGTVAANVLEWGTGAMFIDGARVETDDVGTPIKTPERERDDGWGMGFGSVRDGPATAAGRWPPNFLHDGSDEVTALFPQTNGKPAFPVRGKIFNGDGAAAMFNYDDTGSAARFYPALPFEAEDVEAARIFYCAKASNRDRNDGLEDLPARSNAERAGRNMGRNGRAAVGGSGKPLNGTGLVDPKPNHHPTVKPTSLMRWLVRLVTPRGGTVLDPFMGSGSTGKAAVIEDFNFIGIEREAEYLEIARRRIDAARLPLFAIEASDDPAE